MNVWLNFAGWFQVRLATDPDPTDEPRGVSGYVHALAGEPDLDRIIRFQAPGTVRRHFCPEIGVHVRSVVYDEAEMAGHPLVGATVELLDDPVFEARNGIVAGPGFEPIVPFHLRVAKGSFNVQRRHLDLEEFPFADGRGSGIQPGITDIAEANGIWDLWDVWQARKAQVDELLATTTDEVERAALAQRSRLLTSRGLTFFYPSRVPYAMLLQGAAEFSDPDGWLPGPAATDTPWFVDMWFGGWDADAVSGFVKGSLAFGLQQPPTPAAVGPPEASPAAEFSGTPEAEVSLFTPPPAPPRAPRRP